MFRLITPDLRLESVLELDVPRVRDLGLDALLLDVDCTLKPYRAEQLAPEVVEWISRLRAAGVRLCLVSNGLGRRVRGLAASLGLPLVARAGKPLPLGCWRAIRRLGLDRRRTAMVGDQLFADVMAGRLAGLTCILVRPIRPEEEPWFTRLKRPLERMVLRKKGIRPILRGSYGRG
jgi:HAD superfamily phosphatase (TIGR01668 family)